MNNKSPAAPHLLFGFDVASHRADDLDRIMLCDVSCLDKPIVLDLGCGKGGQSLRLIQAGAQVTGIDIADQSSLFAQYVKAQQVNTPVANFVQGNIMNFLALTDEKTYDAVCLQRVIHYLTYDDALTLLISLKQQVTGKLYISVTGLDSAIGSEYTDRQKPVYDRFCRLEADAAQRFFITEPICLYTEFEFRELLIAAGWSIEKMWLSDFGNSKAVCI